ncbi:MAG: UDP-N-acetylmuramate--L-alanine ligase [Patescibacteria group bacterium]|nr:UDP-N-acetylmuramate--L-alanine ligase [Patescibacteria group bacterium]
MQNIHNWKHVHLIGIGGINMSAVAKILLKSGITVTGSDVHESEITREMQNLGIKVTIGPHDERNVPVKCDGVIHTSAAPETNPERIAAKNRNIIDINNFEWMGAWFKKSRTVVVAGTHGKSTVTALLGMMCIEGGLDPTVIVGSKVPGWVNHNLHLGNSDLVIIEGDEYAKHFLEFHPEALIINNMELDHTDVYANIDELRKTFERLIRQTKIGATIVANAEFEQTVEAIKPLLVTQKLNVNYFSRPNRSKIELRTKNKEQHLSDVTIKWKYEKLQVAIKTGNDELNLTSDLIGEYNGLNLTSAALMAQHLGASNEAIQKVAQTFPGIWRRMELIGEYKGVNIYSDYGHHPSAVSAVVTAVREAYPEKRLVLCFQPHHKNRTKNLWLDFISCFDRADVLVLCEIYDVAGRASSEDAGVTSAKLLEEIKARDIARPLDRMEFAPNPESAVNQTLKLLKDGDICIFMGAGDIDSVLRVYLHKHSEELPEPVKVPQI